MATVPDDDIPSVGAEALPGRAIPRFDDSVPAAAFGAAVGNALEGTGVRLGEEQKQEARRAAAEAKQEAEKAQRQADAVRVAQANTTLSGYVTNQLYTADDAAYKQQGVEAVAMDSKYLPGFDKQAADIRDLLTPDQQAAFDVHSSQQRSEMQLGLARYEKEAGDRTAQQTFSAAGDQFTSAAGLNWRGMGDPRTYTDTKANLTAIAEAGADRLKLGKKETTGALVDRMLGTVTRNALSDGGVPFASRFLEAHKDELTNPDLYHQLKNEIDAEARRKEATLKDGLADKFQDAVKGSLANIPGSPRLISDRELQILYPRDWQQKRDFLNKAGVTGAAEKQFDQMNAAGMQAHLDSIDPTKGAAHYGQAQDIDLFNMQVAAAQRSLARRQADPRDFAQKNYGDAVIDFNKPIDKIADTISTRAATARDDSERLGVNMPLLSKPEAAQFSNALANAAPPQQLQMITQMRDSLGDDRVFKGLMEQVRPNDPVIAEAAVRVPRNPETAPLWYNAKYDNDAQTSQEILAGNALLAPKGEMKAEEGKGGIRGGVAMPSEKELRLAFNSHFDDYLFHGNPIAADQTYAAFRSLYAARVAKIGDTSGNVVSDAVKYASDKLLPNTDSHFAGSPVPVPPGMDPATFPDRINDAVAASLKSRGDNPNLFKGHGLVQVGRLGSGDYTVLSADGQNVAVYPGTSVPVRIHLDSQYARPGPTKPKRASVRSFPQRPTDASVTIGPDYNGDIPDSQYPANNPADFAAAGG